VHGGHIARVPDKSQLLAVRSSRLYGSGLPCMSARGGRRLVLVAGADGVVAPWMPQPAAFSLEGTHGRGDPMPPTIWEGRAFVGSGDGWM
jgi:hypothetical protein